jgi:predicted GNAT family acetyltransferase
VEVERTDDRRRFEELAHPLLLEDEARHNLILGILGTLAHDPGFYPERSFWLVHHGEGVAAAAIRTPPFNLLVAKPRFDAALEALARAIDDDLPGVTGACPEVDVFAAAWTARTGTHLRTEFEQRIYALTRVRPPRPVAGTARLARADDRALLLEWYRAFSVEALHEDEPDDERIATIVDRRLRGDGPRIVLWDDGGVVSLAGVGGETPHGTRIGPVYTPPGLRGRGYASALVAAVSAEELAAGRRFCFLYTDLANPTSNRIYTAIGYEPACDSRQLAFER